MTSFTTYIHVLLQLLTKQVEVLRHANDSRMRIFEDIDRNAQDLEKLNSGLRQNLREEKAKVKKYVHQFSISPSWNYAFILT